MRFFLALALIALQTAAAESRITVAGRAVDMWKPEGLAPAKGFPVIVFSHGFLGCGTQSSFLTEALAHAGYFVLAPNHHDARCGGGTPIGFPQLQQSFVKPDAWSEATYQDRATDVRAVLDAALASKSFEGVRVDRDRVALAGHSLGGYTVLGLAGAWPSWKDPRVKAVLALSPFCEPYVQKGGLAHLKIPVMYQGGTLDLGITPTVARPDGAYDSSSGPKIFVEFAGAEHFAWTDMIPKYQSIIVEYSVAFFDRYVRQDSHALDSLTSKPLPKRVKLLRSDLD
jgi:predicted dienelactone hydrolase